MIINIKKFLMLVGLVTACSSVGAELIPRSPDVGDWQYWRYTKLCPDYFGARGPFDNFDAAYQIATEGSSTILSEKWTPYSLCGINFPKVKFNILTGATYQILFGNLADGDPNDVDGAGYVVKRRTVSCPWGTNLSNDRFCLISGPDSINNGSQCDVAGNPIHIGTGNKYQREVDFAPVSSKSLLALERSYNSSNRWRGVFGAKWTSLLDLRITSFNSASTNSQWVLLEDGKLLTFNNINGSWVSVPHTNYLLVEIAEGYELRNGLKVYTFDSAGNIVSISDPNRGSLTFIYTNDLISRIDSSDGEFIEFTYNSDWQIGSATLSSGEEVRYIYDTDGGVPGHGNLIRVEWEKDSVTTTREYHYENSAQPAKLTGITDEKGVRFASWEYDTAGRAIASDHAGGVERTTLDYTYINDSVSPRVTVTNPLGKQTTYYYQDIEGAKKVVQVEGHPTASCAGASKNYTYTVNGQIETKTDWQGNVTRYVYNSRGLEITRTEAEGGAAERTIATEWHPILSIKTKLIEKGKETSYRYTAEGKLQSTSIKAKPVTTE